MSLQGFWLCRVVQQRFEDVRKSLAKRMIEFERAIRLTEHDERASEGAETRLLRVCQAHTNRYLQTFQRAALPAKTRVSYTVAPCTSAGSLWDAVREQDTDRATSSTSFLDVKLAVQPDVGVNAEE